MTTIYELISLYKIGLLGALCFFGVIDRNAFVGVFILAVFALQAITMAMKYAIKNKRPNCAYDCGLFNEGGDYSNKPGFPSGHAAFASFVFIYALISKIKNTRLSLISFYMLLLTSIARVENCCHTKTQVAGGIAIGALFAIVFSMSERSFGKRYQADKQRFITLVSS